MLAEIGLGSLLWSLLVIYLMVMYFVIMFTVVIDVFRSDDMGGGKKALWLIAMLFLPIITLVAYLITRGDSMGERNLARAKRQEQEFQAHIREVAAPGTGVASELEKAKGLLDSGVIDAAEFATIKNKLLA